jgi:endonuclease/exonuclease/phosphatase family metal-dependent hydrolase
VTLRTGGAIVAGIVIAAILVGVLQAARRGRAQNFLDPKLPVFTGVPGEQTGGTGWEPRPDGRISVVSFNVHFGYKTGDIVPTLRANGMDKADIVLLQESNERTAREVAEGLGASWAYYPATVHPTSNDLFGVAVLSRWPILAHRKILLTDRSWFDAARKVAMTAVIDVAGVSIQVVNVHLQSGMLPNSYRVQLARVLACATRNECEDDAEPGPLPPAGALVIGGDFNTWYGGLRGVLTSVMAGASLRPVEGIEGTFSKDPTETTPKNTFDYFFASPRLITGPGRAGTVRIGSDHWPIEATFQIR